MLTTTLIPTRPNQHTWPTSYSPSPSSSCSLWNTSMSASPKPLRNWLLGEVMIWPGFWCKSPARDLACRTNLWFSRGGYHKSHPSERPHHTVHGFKSDGFAYWTIHVFSSDRCTIFSNGGVWKEGGCYLDMEQDCELLWCVIILLHCSCVDISFKKMPLHPSYNPAVIPHYPSSCSIFLLHVCYVNRSSCSCGSVKRPRSIVFCAI